MLTRDDPASEQRRTYAGPGEDSGMVTAETAAVLPVLALLLAFGLWAQSAVGAQTRCDDAAREAARLSARGEPVAVVEAAARRAAPQGAGVVLARVDDQVRVVVTVKIGPRGGRLPSITVSGSATALLEPEVGVADGPGTAAFGRAGPASGARAGPGVRR